jgi:hypothetical protein
MSFCNVLFLSNTNTWMNCSSKAQIPKVELKLLKFTKKRAEISALQFNILLSDIRRPL